MHPVAGVSGSCMLIRRAVIDQIGYLDERFFAYQKMPIFASGRDRLVGRFFMCRKLSSSIWRAGWLTRPALPLDFRVAQILFPIL